MRQSLLLARNAEYIGRLRRAPCRIQAGRAQKQIQMGTEGLILVVVAPDPGSL